MIIITILLNCFVYLAKAELKFVFEIFRHGARTPLSGDSENIGELNPVGQR